MTTAGLMASEVIRERSVAGTNRVAEARGWMGGIVPFGYRKAGDKRDAHLVVSGDPIPGLAMSEAEVIREVFRMAAVEKKSCRVIAAKLINRPVPTRRAPALHAPKVFRPILIGCNKYGFPASTLKCFTFFWWRITRPMYC